MAYHRSPAQQARLEQFAERLSQHDAEAGEPGGNIVATGAALGMSRDASYKLFQSMCRRFGEQWR